MQDHERVLFEKLLTKIYSATCNPGVVQRAICIEDGADCLQVWGIFKITETGTTLLRVESQNGTVISEYTLRDCGECSNILLWK